MKWRQITIRTVFLIAVGVGIFCAGYRIGFDNGRDARFDDLIQLIQETIVPSSDWQTDSPADPRHTSVPEH